MSAVMTAFKTPPLAEGRYNNSIDESINNARRSILACNAVSIMVEFNYGLGLREVAAIRSLCRRLKGTRIRINVLRISYSYMRSAVNLVFANYVKGLSFALYCPASTIPEEYSNLISVHVESYSMITYWFLNSIPQTCRHLSIAGHLPESLVNGLHNLDNLQGLVSLKLSTSTRIMMPVQDRFGLPLQMLELINVVPKFTFVDAFDGLLNLSVEGLCDVDVKKMLEHLPSSLRSLTIAVSDVCDETLEPLEYTQIQHLKLWLCRYLTIDVIDSFPKSLESLHLEDLWMTESHDEHADFKHLTLLNSLAVVNVHIEYYIMYLPESLRRLMIDVRNWWGGDQDIISGLFHFLPSGLISLHTRGLALRSDTTLRHTNIEDLALKRMKYWYPSLPIVDCLPSTLTRLDISRSSNPWGDPTVFANLKGLNTLILGKQHGISPHTVAVLRSSIDSVID